MAQMIDMAIQQLVGVVDEQLLFMNTARHVLPAHLPDFVGIEVFHEKRHSASPAGAIIVR